MKAGWSHWMKCSATAASSVVLLTSSCSRQPIQSLEETSEEITVEGAFADWSPTAETFTFAGGTFALLDATTNEIYASEIKTNSFKIEKVPAQGRYYGLLLGPDYQVRAKLQKKSVDATTDYFVFKTGATLGQLGTLVVKDGQIESSQQSELEFQTNLGASKTPEPFKGEYSTNFVANPDIDSDGVANVIDDNVDGDDFINLLDPKTFGNAKEDSIVDAKIPWQHNHAYGIPKTGFFKCDQLKSPVTGKLKNNIDFWCTLKIPANSAEKVTLKTFSFEKEVEMVDDGGKSQPTNKDPTANDGLWNARFSIDTNKNVLFPKQLILAKATMKNGATKTYVTLLGPEFPLTLRFKPDKDAQTPTTVLKTDSLKTEIVIEKWRKEDKQPKGFMLEVILLNKDDSTFIKSFTKSINGAGDNLTDENKTDAVFSFAEESKISELGLTANAYKIKARIIGPAALPGLVGSAAETAVTDVTVTAPQ